MRFAELQKKLAGAPQRFTVKTSTELILHPLSPGDCAGSLPEELRSKIDRESS